MCSYGAFSENIESIEEQEQVYHLRKCDTYLSNLKEDLTRCCGTLGPSRQKAVDLLGKYTLKKGVWIPHGAREEISESLTLKQAFRKLCISRAAEMAAIKRLSLTHKSSSAYDVETIKKLYSSIVLHAKETGPSAEARQNVMESPVVPEVNPSYSNENVSDVCSVQNAEPCIRDFISSHCSTTSTTYKESAGSVESSSVAELIRIKGKVLPKTYLVNVEVSKAGMRPPLKKTVLKRKCFNKSNAMHVHDEKCRISEKSNEMKISGSVSGKTKMSHLKDSTPSCNNRNPTVKIIDHNKGDNKHNVRLWVL